MWKRAGEEAKRQGQPEMTFLESKISFFKEYSDLMQSSYRKPWPRPWLMAWGGQTRAAAARVARVRPSR